MSIFLPFLKNKTIQLCYQFKNFIFQEIFCISSDGELLEEKSLIMLAEGLKSDGKLRIETEFLIKRWKNNWETDNRLNDYLHESALINNRGSVSNRFSGNLKPLKDFCTYTYLKGGPSCYEGLSLNSVIPSAVTCRREIHENEVLEIGKFYIDEFLMYLEGQEITCSDVIIAEDATRLMGRVEFCAKTNQLYGLLPDINESLGLPKKNFFKFENPSQVYNYLKNYKVAPYLQIITAKPMIFGKKKKIKLNLIQIDFEYISRRSCKNNSCISN